MATKLHTAKIDEVHLQERTDHSVLVRAIHRARGVKEVEITLNVDCMDDATLAAEYLMGASVTVEVPSRTIE